MHSFINNYLVAYSASGFGWGYGVFQTQNRCAAYGQVCFSYMILIQATRARLEPDQKNTPNFPNDFNTLSASANVRFPCTSAIYLKISVIYICKRPLIWGPNGDHAPCAVPIVYFATSHGSKNKSLHNHRIDVNSPHTDAIHFKIDSTFTLESTLLAFGLKSWTVQIPVCYSLVCRILSYHNCV